MFQAGEGVGPDYFVMFVISTIVLPRNLDETIKLLQKHVMMSKKTNTNRAAFQNLDCFVRISYLLCASEVVF